jgi:hypothetical protein
LTGFSSRLGALVEGEVFDLLVEVRSSGKVIAEVIFIPIAPFCISCWRFSTCISILFFRRAKLLKEGAPVL